MHSPHKLRYKSMHSRTVLVSQLHALANNSYHNIPSSIAAQQQPRQQDRGLINSEIHDRPLSKMTAYRIFCTVIGIATAIAAAAISAELPKSLEAARTVQYCCTTNCWFCVALTCNPKDPQCSFPVSLAS